MRNENFLHASYEVLVAEHCHILAVRDLSLHESDIVHSIMKAAIKIWSQFRWANKEKNFSKERDQRSFPVVTESRVSLKPFIPQGSVFKGEHIALHGYSRESSMIWRESYQLNFEW